MQTESENLLSLGTEIYSPKLGKGVIKIYNENSKELNKSYTGVTKDFEHNGSIIEFLISYIPKFSNTTHPYVCVFEDRTITVLAPDEFEVYDPVKHG